jgi:hypothetical protein
MAYGSVTLISLHKNTNFTITEETERLDRHALCLGIYIFHKHNRFMYRKVKIIASVFPTCEMNGSSGALSPIFNHAAG